MARIAARRWQREPSRPSDVPKVRDRSKGALTRGRITRFGAGLSRDFRGNCVPRWIVQGAFEKGFGALSRLA